ncbi:MAG: hypothetical protein HQL17_06435 [Candidatus Omnitrophica bacterium]|nr:hypothetical protein [Candidatus Omnitrophota bacterium]
MEIVVVFVIFGIALTAFVAYMRKTFKEGDGCSKCSGGKSSCGGGSRQGGCG